MIAPTTPRKSPSKIRILIADDHAMLRETWSLLLNSDPRFQVVAQCGNGDEALASARALRPDIVMMDICMPGTDGLQATQLIRKYAPGTKVLGVSLHNQPAYARRMMKNGAAGYVTKNSPLEEMVQALLDVSNNNRYICKEVKNILSDQLVTGNSRGSGLNALSARELEVIDYVRKGNSSREIAKALFLSVKTVEVHRFNILKKLNLKNSAALVNFIHHHHVN